MLFELADLDHDFNEPLTPAILSNSSSRVVKHILYLYSMECFIYENLNRMCREKDHSKIQFYGAFAAALSYIIHSANSNRTEDKLQKTTLLYRGVKLSVLEANSYSVGTTINLLGYTSTS